MPLIRIPLGTIVKVPQPLTHDSFEQALFELCDPARDFTGFIAVRSDTSLYLLFIFNSRPYAAGKSVDEHPSLLPITDFFLEIGLLDGSEPLFSIHATDPVLFKSLLVYLHNKPSTRAPAPLANLETVLKQIRHEAADAVIVLEKRGMLNFFFIKDGGKGKSYYTDQDAVLNAGLTKVEQMLWYATQGDGVQALIYLNTETPEYTDTISISLTELLNLLRTGADGSGSTNISAKPAVNEAEQAAVVEDHLLLSILDGPLTGKTLAGPIPCVLGRKETDIILPDPMVSKTHAAIQMVNGKLLLIDLNSTNGTTVNGQKIKQQEIAAGDIIGIADIHLKVVHIRLP